MMKLCFWKSRTQIAFPLGAVIENIREQGGFQDFATPMGDNALLPDGLTFPRFPGETVYKDGPLHLN